MPKDPSRSPSDPGSDSGDSSSPAGRPARTDASNDEREWGDRSVGEVATDGPDDGAAGNAGPDDDDDDDDRPVPEPNSATIEAGRPDPENVLFVVLGAVAMVLVIFRLVSIGVAG